MMHLHYVRSNMRKEWTKGVRLLASNHFECLKKVLHTIRASTLHREISMVSSEVLSQATHPQRS
jgi:hypothetical protein